MDRFLSWMSDCNSVQFIWKFPGKVFTSTENGLVNVPKKNQWFFAVLKPILKFLYQNANRGCIFFALHRAVFSQWIKMCNVTCHNLSWHCTVPSLCPVFSSDIVNSVLMFGCCWAVGALLGLGHSGRQGHSDSCARPHVAQRLWIEHACSSRYIK